VLNISNKERQAYIKERADEAQIRLYGAKFGDPASQDYLSHTTQQSLWASYLLNESRNIGNYELLYPTNCYTNQTTKGNQEIYDKLLRIADELFWRGIGIGPVKSAKVQVPLGISFQIPTPPVEQMKPCVKIWRKKTPKRSKSAVEQRRKSLELSYGISIRSFSEGHRELPWEPDVLEQKVPFESTQTTLTTVDQPVMVDNRTETSTVVESGMPHSSMESSSSADEVLNRIMRESAEYKAHYHKYFRRCLRRQRQDLLEHSKSCDIEEDDTTIDCLHISTSSELSTCES
jgi:hypothetical protein